jgi:hypothetical protein
MKRIATGILATGLAALVLAGCVMPGMPGMGGATMGPGGMNAAEAAQMSASMQQAQAAGAAQASRPGDDKMDCAAIQAELMAQMQDPTFKAAMASMGAKAQGTKAIQDSAMASGKQASQKDIDTSQANMKGMSGDVTTMMPQIMRGQRLNELATAKKCAFLKGPA